MGNFGSKSKESSPTSREPSPTTQPPPQVFREDPWRKIKGWGKSERDQLKSQVEELCCEETSLHNSTFNIVLTGQISSGKSSFYNSINGLFRGIISPTKAAAGKMARSLTKEFKMYRLRQDLPIRIGDTMGVDAHTSEADIRSILNVVEGHVPDGYEFTHGKEYHSTSPGYIANPLLAERAHCVVIVINAHAFSHMKDDHAMVLKLQSLAEGLMNRNIPIVVLLTHLDEYCPEVAKDITKTYHSTSLEKMVQKISMRVHGLPENQIFPVINYHKDVELDDNMDILLLYALRTMITAARGYLENQESSAACKTTTKLNRSQQEEGGLMEVEKPSVKTPTECKDASPMEL